MSTPRLPEWNEVNHIAPEAKAKNSENEPDSSIVNLPQPYRSQLIVRAQQARATYAAKWIEAKKMLSASGLPLINALNGYYAVHHGFVNDLTLLHFEIFFSDSAITAFKEKLITPEVAQSFFNHTYLKKPVFGREILTELFSDVGLTAMREGWLRSELIVNTLEGAQNLAFILSHEGKTAIENQRIIVIKSKEDKSRCECWQMTSTEVLRVLLPREHLKCFLSPHGKIAVEKNYIANKAQFKEWDAPVLHSVLTDNGLSALENKYLSMEDLYDCPAPIAHVLFSDDGLLQLKDKQMDLDVIKSFQDPEILKLMFSINGLLARAMNFITLEQMSKEFDCAKQIEVMISPVGRFALANGFLTYTVIKRLNITPVMLKLMLTPQGLVALNKGLLQQPGLTIEQAKEILTTLECDGKSLANPAPSNIIYPLSIINFDKRIHNAEVLIANKIAEFFPLVEIDFLTQLQEALQGLDNINRFIVKYFSYAVSSLPKFELAHKKIWILAKAYMEFSIACLGRDMLPHELDRIEICKKMLLDFLIIYLHEPSVDLAALNKIRESLILDRDSLLHVKKDYPSPKQSWLFIKPDPYKELNEATRLLDKAIKIKAIKIQETAASITLKKH